MLYSSLQIGMDTGLFHLVFFVFLVISMSTKFSNIIVTLVFLNSFMDFESVFEFI